MVMGTAATSGFNTVNLQTAVDSAQITVGQNGALISSGASAIRGIARETFHLVNAGLISGFNEAINLSFISGSGATPDSHIVNSGRILSNGDLSSEATSSFSSPAGRSSTLRIPARS